MRIGSRDAVQVMTTSAARDGLLDGGGNDTADVGGRARRARGVASPDADLAQLGPDDAERFDLLACLEPGADHGHDLDAFGRQPSPATPPAAPVR